VGKEDGGVKKVPATPPCMNRCPPRREKGGEETALMKVGEKLVNAGYAFAFPSLAKPVFYEGKGGHAESTTDGSRKPI